MTDPEKSFPYEPYTILVAWTAASLGSCSFILISLCRFAGVQTDFSGDLIVGNGRILLAAVWCAASYFCGAVFAWSLAKAFQRVIPAWVVVSLVGTLIYVLTSWSYTYWNSVRTYNPGDPFSSPPPAFDVVLVASLSDLYWFLVFSASISYIASVLLAEKPVETVVHLN